jgi:hypothetical protein
MSNEDVILDLEDPVWFAYISPLLEMISRLRLQLSSYEFQIPVLSDVSEDRSRSSLVGPDYRKLAEQQLYCVLNWEKISAEMELLLGSDGSTPSNSFVFNHP